MDKIEQAEDSLRRHEVKITMRGIENDVKGILHKVKRMEWLVRKLHHEEEEVGKNGI